MSEKMSISVNGLSQVPPGFRFHPTEEELLRYYLRKKVSNKKIDLDVIRDIDLNKLEPWDIQEKCKIGTTPQNDWYFFSQKDKKYPTGTRTNRATAAGFWKATGHDKVIYGDGKRIGMRKTLVFYKGRAPHGQKSDWIMHEYRLDDGTPETNVSNVMMGDTNQEEGWVVCRIFKKKYLHKKTLETPNASSFTPIGISAQHMFDSPIDDGALEQILHYNRFTEFPCLYLANSRCQQPIDPEMVTDNEGCVTTNTNYQVDSALTNWAAFDRLFDSQLNGQGQSDISRTLLPSFNNPNMVCCTDHDLLQLPALRSTSSNSSIRSDYHATQDDDNYYNNNETDLWSFAPLSSASSLWDRLCYGSNNHVCP